MDTIEKGIYLGLLIEVVVFVTLSGYFIINIIGYHQKKKRAYEQKLLDEIALAEKERQKIGSDLHDGFSSALAALKLRVECIDTVDDRSAKIRDDTVSILAGMMQKMRQVSHHMMPETLKEKGLVPAIEELVGMTSTPGTMQVSFHACSRKYPLSREKELHIFRAVQEILFNVFKHSGADKVEINITRKAKAIFLSIKDNGQGFDKQEVIKNNSGTGLRNILSRIEIAKGKIFLETRKGEGVHFLIEIPAAHEYQPS